VNVDPENERDTRKNSYIRDDENRLDRLASQERIADGLFASRSG
jgi:hypothetical protein